MKRILIFIFIFMLVSNTFGQTNDPRIKDIEKKLTEIYEGKGYVLEQQAKPGGGVCFMYIDVKKKDNEVREIHAYDKNYFDYQYYFWDEKVIFIFIKKRKEIGTDEKTGKTIYLCYEYRHFFDDGECFKTMYTQYTQLEGHKPVNKQSINMYDLSRATDDKNKAEKYLGHAKADNWYGICGK